MNTFFTSDTHFGHKNIIKYCNRPFSSVEEMDAEIIKAWNMKVSDKDVVYHLGDFAFCRGIRLTEILQSLKGEIHLIVGNHDTAEIRNHKRFASVSQYTEIGIQDEEMGLNQKLILFHFPIQSWHHAHHGSWHLHGHCHGTLPSSDHQARLDVGVDCQGTAFAPISYDKIKLIMTRKVFKPIDHHGEPR